LEGVFIFFRAGMLTCNWARRSDWREPSFLSHKGSPRVIGEFMMRFHTLTLFCLLFVFEVLAELAQGLLFPDSVLRRRKLHSFSSFILDSNFFLVLLSRQPRIFNLSPFYPLTGPHASVTNHHRHGFHGPPYRLGFLFSRICP